MGTQGANALALMVGHRAGWDARPAPAGNRLLLGAALAPADPVCERPLASRAARFERCARAHFAFRPGAARRATRRAAARGGGVALAGARPGLGARVVLRRGHRGVGRLAASRAETWPATHV